MTISVASFGFDINTKKYLKHSNNGDYWIIKIDKSIERDVTLIRDF